MDEDSCWSILLADRWWKKSCQLEEGGTGTKPSEVQHGRCVVARWDFR
jgi:hypothetical protein